MIIMIIRSSLTNEMKFRNISINILEKKVVIKKTVLLYGFETSTLINTLEINIERF